MFWSPSTVLYKNNKKRKEKKRKKKKKTLCTSPFPLSSLSHALLTFPLLLPSFPLPPSILPPSSFPPTLPSYPFPPIPSLSLLLSYLVHSETLHMMSRGTPVGLSWT